MWSVVLFCHTQSNIKWLFVLNFLLWFYRTPPDEAYGPLLTYSLKRGSIGRDWKFEEPVATDPAWVGKNCTAVSIRVRYPSEDDAKAKELVSIPSFIVFVLVTCGARFFCTWTYCLATERLFKQDASFSSWWTPPWPKTDSLNQEHKLSPTSYKYKEENEATHQ